MFNFGDLFLETSTISWLIWIQLIVFLLLFFLLIFVIAFDPSYDSSTATSSGSATVIHHSLTKHHSSSTLVTNRLQNMLGEENKSIKGEMATSSSTSIVREEIAEREASQLYLLDPCYYLRLARVAFLKCLGLDFEYDGPSTQKYSRRKEN
ncbi:PREDICTED: uncharacterized protein LOC109342937 [Lupinus angustifolius]|uniref:uncharacterized protein LOC109342937 n=1 Tax=Lupinus angustifolius TaxID=3871 RepID=UPI00092FAF5A|nr:PREDICTED: uncharacterized protein LOC109342937 [Lupinus angustifolius]